MAMAEARVRRSVKPASLLLASIALSGTALAARQYVACPSVEWEVMLPYVRANIVADLHDGEFHVFVCQGQTDRAVVTPFDDALSDFAKVLVFQAMRKDARVVDGIEGATQRFRQRVPSLSSDERLRYRDLFWEVLSEEPDVLPRLRSLFENCRSKGTLRCWACERDRTFAPLAERTRGRR